MQRQAYRPSRTLAHKRLKPGPHGRPQWKRREVLPVRRINDDKRRGRLGGRLIPWKTTHNSRPLDGWRRCGPVGQLGLGLVHIHDALIFTGIFFQAQPSADRLLCISIVSIVILDASPGGQCQIQRLLRSPLLFGSWRV